KYSEALGARFKDAEGKEQPIWMGCYGIGVTRTMAAIIEQHHDYDGIIWPVTVAPYQAIVVPIKATDADQIEAAKKVYEQLWTAGLAAVVVDRADRRGVKFKGAELIGYPVRITVGQKALAAGRVEVRWRDNRREERHLLSEVVGVVQAGRRER